MMDREDTKESRSPFLKDSSQQWSSKQAFAGTLLSQIRSCYRRSHLRIASRWTSRSAFACHIVSPSDDETRLFPHCLPLRLFSSWHGRTGNSRVPTESRQSTFLHVELDIRECLEQLITILRHWHIGILRIAISASPFVVNRAAFFSDFFCSV